MDTKHKLKKITSICTVPAMALCLSFTSCNEDRLYPAPMPTDVAIKTLGYYGMEGRIGGGDFEKDTLFMITGVPEDGDWDYELTVGTYSENGTATVTDSKAYFANTQRLEWWIALEADENDSVDVEITLISETLGYEEGTFTGKFKKDIYNIYTWQDLQAMQDDLDGAYTLKTDIEFPDPAENGFPEQGFLPIGVNKSSPFTGTFNGDGYALKGFFINREYTNFVGLFGVLSEAEVNNLKLELSDLGVTGYDYVGALAGYVDENTTIEDCKAEGEVYGNSYTGGLVGYISDNSTITLSRMTGSVTGTSCTGGVIGYATSGSNIGYCFCSGTVEGTDSVGGLIGAAKGSIENCQSDSVVVSGESCTGGLIGWGYGTVENCSVAAGKVQGDSATGGLVGLLESSGSISESCNKADVSGAAYTGGLVGINHGETQNSYGYGGSVQGVSVTGGLIGLSDNTVKNCYASMATANTGSTGGGFIGKKSGTATNCYWDNGKTSLGAVGSGDTYGIEEAETATFTSFDPSEGGVREVFLGWDFSDIWAILSNKNTGYPYLLIERNLSIDF